MPGHARPKAVLTDDHPAVLTAVGGLLEPEFEIVALANDGRQALEAVTRFRPELLILDIAMPGWNGFETAERVLQNSSSTRLLFLSVYEDIDYIGRARELGASYVFKRRMRADLLTAARTTLQGSLFCSALRENLQR
jgi:DNA-binding NarL/FixJ family response regulator